jgi:hypothetical protein
VQRVPELAAGGPTVTRAGHLPRLPRSTVSPGSASQSRSALSSAGRGAPQPAAPARAASSPTLPWQSYACIQTGAPARYNTLAAALPSTSTTPSPSTTSTTIGSAAVIGPS